MTDPASVDIDLDDLARYFTRLRRQDASSDDDGASHDPGTDGTQLPLLAIAWVVVRGPSTIDAAETFLADARGRRLLVQAWARQCPNLTLLARSARRIQAAAFDSDPDAALVALTRRLLGSCHVGRCTRCRAVLQALGSDDRLGAVLGQLDATRWLRLPEDELPEESDSQARGDYQLTRGTDGWAFSGPPEEDGREIVVVDPRSDPALRIERLTGAAGGARINLGGLGVEGFEIHVHPDAVTFSAQGAVRYVDALDWEWLELSLARPESLFRGGPIPADEALQGADPDSGLTVTVEADGSRWRVQVSNAAPHTRYSLALGWGADDEVSVEITTDDAGGLAVILAPPAGMTRPPSRIRIASH